MVTAIAIFDRYTDEKISVHNFVTLQPLESSKNVALCEITQLVAT